MGGREKLELTGAADCFVGVAAVADAAVNTIELQTATSHRGTIPNKRRPRQVQVIVFILCSSMVLFDSLVKLSAD